MHWKDFHPPPPNHSCTTPLQAMSTSISQNMWTSNPGYLARDGVKMTSNFKKDFTYDQEEVCVTVCECEGEGEKAQLEPVGAGMQAGFALRDEMMRW